MAGQIKKSNEDRLQDAFQYVRKTFFPRWDRKKEWTVVYLPEFKKRDEQRMAEDIRLKGLQGAYPFKLNITAICPGVGKCIIVYRIPKNNNELYELLIHEICHAISKDGHRKKWVEKMNVAYSRAIKDVLKDLSKRIKADLAKEDLAEKIRIGKI